MSAKWLRVSKASPCPICKKPNWCCIGERYINCMRVFSDKICENGGYLHPVGSSPPPRPPQPEAIRPTIDAEKLWSEWSEATPRTWIEEFACKLGVTVDSLVAVGCVWADPHRAWAFPMRDGYGEIIGIRLRDDFGHKWAVTGSRQGIFIPSVNRQDTAYICEGPTDTAAALTMGLFALGRPSCNGCVIQTVTALRHKKVSRAVIFSDNDGPGLQGSKFLSNELPIPSCILIPPAKDAREALKFGMTRQLVESLISSLVWHVPKLQC